MSIVFSADDHTYKHSETGETYTSVSKVIASFKKPFNKDFWSTYKAFERILGKNKLRKLKKGFELESDELIMHLSQYVDQKELTDVRNEILKEWKNKNKSSITRGNMYHKNQEKRSYIEGVQENPFTKNKSIVHVPENIEIKDGKITPKIITEIDNYIDSGHKETRVAHLFELEDGYHPELLLWNDKYMIAGQADKVFLETDKTTGIRYAYLDDYKTNTKIKKDNRYQFMNHPLNHLSDCNYNHYRIQISTYAWMLEQFGFEIRNTAFTHFNKMYEFEYMRNDVENMLNAFKQKTV